MLRKHAARFGLQWDRYLSGVLWAYRNTPHDSTGEKPSFLLFGMDLRTPTEAALLPPTPLEPTDVEGYREELVLNLSSARELAVKSLQQSQKRGKRWYDQTKSTAKSFCIGEWVLVRFPHEETGRNRKLSQPWHGPYHVLSYDEPDVTAQKVYRHQDRSIQVHQSRVTSCPSGLPPGYYWYGRKHSSSGRPPRWVDAAFQVPVTDSDPLSSSADNIPPPSSHAQPFDNGHNAPVTLEPDVPVTIESEPRSSGRYSLRDRVKPPETTPVTLGSSFSSGGSDVTYLDWTRLLIYCAFM